jgi:iron complex outermembrane recepter protein
MKRIMFTWFLFFISFNGFAAEEADNVIDNNEDLDKVEEVVITGSRIKRIDAPSAVPVFVITSEDIKASGFRDVAEALQALPQANAGHQNETGVNEFTPNASSIDLRRLGASRVLYLINGRRTADYPLAYNNESSFVNTRTVPAGLVDRIEVVSQGSSAIYGSDAVTGVINIITKKGKEYSELDFNLVQTEHGGDNISNLTFTTGGFSNDSSWTFGINRTEVDPMYLADRDGFNSYQDNPRFAEVGASAPYVQLFQIDGTLQRGPYPGLSALGGNYSSEDFGYACDSQEISGGQGYLYSRDKPELYGNSGYGGSYAGYYCAYDYGKNGGFSQTLVNQREDTTVMASYSLSLDNGVELDTRVSYFENSSYNRSNIPRWANIGDVLDPLRLQAAVGALPNNDLRPLNPNVSYLATHGRYFTPGMGSNFERDTGTEEDNLDIFLGLTGAYDNGYEWSVGLNTTKYNTTLKDKEFTMSIKDWMAGKGMMCADSARADGLCHSTYEQNFPWASALDADRFNSLTGPEYGSEAHLAAAVAEDAQYACGYQAGWLGISNCFFPDRMLGIMTNEEAGGFLEDDTTNSWSKQTLLDYSVTGEFVMYDRPIGFAAVVEYHTQEYNVTPSAGRLDDTRYGGDDAIQFINGSSRYGGGERSRKSVGVELSIPATDKLDIGLATRYDKYDDDSSSVGGRLSSMVNFAYKPIENLLLRGSASQSFKAPDMAYVYNKPVTSYGQVVDSIACFKAGTAISFADCENTYKWQSIVVNAEGNKNLEEEEGENISVGFVWDVTENISVQWDIYQISIEKAVRNESAQGLVHLGGLCQFGNAYETWLGTDVSPADCAGPASQIVRGSSEFPGVDSSLNKIASIKTLSLNQAYLEYLGHDSYISWGKDFEGIGRLSVTLASTTILDLKQKNDSVSVEVDVLQGDYEPTSQQNLNISWALGKHAVTVFADRMGSMQMSAIPAFVQTSVAYGTSLNQKTKPHILTNISYKYDYADDIKMYLSVRNVADKMPQKDGFLGYYPYYNSEYFSAMGRNVSLGVNWQF